MEKFKLPKPVGELVIDYTSFQGGVERWYFWLLDFLKEDLGYEVKKVEDKFIASEASTWWGVIEQRKGLQQEKAMTYIMHIGNMVKSVFQIIRELRIMDERMGYYTRSNNGDDSAEIALKALWVDMVEGGGKNVNSVTGLASQVGFVTLPDFFYSVHPKKDAAVSKLVEGIDANNKLKEVLKRKLFQYLRWRNTTEIEIKQRRNFVLKSLRQHFNTIKLYVQWIKPYLQNVSKLQSEESGMNEEILTMAEGAIIDLEIFGVNWQKESTPIVNYKTGDKVKLRKRYHPCIQIKFHFRSVPEMMFQQDYQRAPIHVGKSLINFNAYVLTEEQIKKYFEAQDEDTIDTLTSLDASLEALKDDLFKYLKEAGDPNYANVGEGKKAEKTFLQTMFEPFANMLTSFFGVKGKRVEGKLSWKEQKEKEHDEKMKKPATWTERHEKADLEAKFKSAGGKPSGKLWVLYNSFKKTHQLITW